MEVFQKFYFELSRITIIFINCDKSEKNIFSSHYVNRGLNAHKIEMMYSFIKDNFFFFGIKLKSSHLPYKDKFLRCLRC